jgi:transcriptional regulator with XRE-family HTH domain
MPLNGESPSTETRQAFCLALKAARDRRGLTLEEIATATKIPASLFAALERSDLKRWPKGLFRRSFFRDYVRSIGLPVAELCDEFVRLFPDETRAVVTTTTGPAAEAAAPVEDVRLLFDTTWHGPHAPLLSRLLVALLDAGVVVLAAVALTWFQRMNFPAATAIIAVAYFSLATAILGESPASWIKNKRDRVLESLGHGTTAMASPWRRISDVFSSVLGHTGSDASDQVDETDRWLTDAHRVEPALSSRLRVRIKTFQ